MPRLSVFNMVSLDGYFTDANGDMSWAHKHDPEWREFVSGNASGGGVLVFGRITYDMMASFWPTPQALQMNPVVAEGMNSMPKIVFSRTLEKASWNNTTLIRGDILEAMRTLKQGPGADMVILGSGSVVAQLADARLIDEYQVVVSAIVLGGGRTMFAGLKDRLPLELMESRAFGNGNVFLRYRTAVA